MKVDQFVYLHLEIELKLEHFLIIEFHMSGFCEIRVVNCILYYKS